MIAHAQLPLQPEAGAALRTITLLDTSIASTNLGDQIIMEAVHDQLSDLMRDTFTHSVASHEWMGRKSRNLVRHADFAIAGGTNLLSSHMWIRSVWKLSPLDALLCNNVVLMGCGWYQFQKNPDPYTRWMLSRVLSKKHLHSVRDTYTKDMLGAIGIDNVVNTGCPTLWALFPETSRALPRQKGAHVVTTLNTYMPDRDADRRLMEILRQHYRSVSIWIQTSSDYAYALALDPNLKFISPSLQAFDALLTSAEDLDYVGNRLHGGIRALQKGRRAIIIEIDNRAREMGRDFGLPTVERADFSRLAKMIEGPLEICVTPPRQTINQWKSQFNGQDMA